MEILVMPVRCKVQTTTRRKQSYELPQDNQLWYGSKRGRKSVCNYKLL